MMGLENDAGMRNPGGTEAGDATGVVNTVVAAEWKKEDLVGAEVTRSARSRSSEMFAAGQRRRGDDVRYSMFALLRF